MSADLYLHILNLTPKVHESYEILSSLDYTTTSWDPEFEFMDENKVIHSKEPGTPDIKGMTFTDRAELENVIKYEDSLWIGQVSWLGAGLSGDIDHNVPKAVQNISDIFGTEGQFLTITPQLIARIMVGMNQYSTSQYEKRQRRTGVVDGKRVPIYDKRGRQPLTRTFYEGASGVNKRQRVKRWLTKNMSKTMIMETN